MKKVVISKRQGKDFYASARKSKWMDGFIDPKPDIIEEIDSDLDVESDSPQKE